LQIALNGLNHKQRKTRRYFEVSCWLLRVSSWKAHGLQPHRFRQFKLSNDPKFADKLHDVVGLYVEPPAHAIVLSFDEKSQIQALVGLSRDCRSKKGGLAP
jgi:hypothetical protein